MAEWESPSLSQQRYKLVKQASDAYRRAANRRDRARKVLAQAEHDYDDAARALKLAIDAVQPELPSMPKGEALTGEQCCPAFHPDAPHPIHSEDCVTR